MSILLEKLVRKPTRLATIRNFPALAAALALLCGPAPGGPAPAGLEAATDWSRLPPPPLMRNIGNASLKITSRSPEAQAYFNQGLRLLHCFWYFEAYRAFEQAARLDDSAAMPYWGMAEALLNFEMDDHARAAIDQAKSRMKGASEHERSYIRAAADLAERPGADGSAASLQELRALMSRYPDDLNAPEFLAMAEMSGYQPDGRPNPGQTDAQRLLRAILVKHPDDVAANHYWIHSVEDGPHPEAGLKSAELVAGLGSSSGHLVHMPGHLYFRLGHYEKARQAFLNSLRVDEAYLASEHLPPQDDANYAHNLSYLVAACAEAGRYREARKWAKRLDGLPAPLDYASSALHYAIPAGSALLRLDLRFARWESAASDPIEFGQTHAASLGPPAENYQEGWRAYAKGMAALAGQPGQSETDSATRQVEALEAELGKLRSEQSSAPPSDAFWVGGAVRLLELASVELQGNLKSAKGDNAGAFRLLKQALDEEKSLGYTEPPYYARPVEETLAAALSRAHAREVARQAYRQELQLRPQSGFALFGIAQSFELEGRASEATRAYENFLAAWSHADRDLPQVRAAEAWLNRRR